MQKITLDEVKILQMSLDSQSVNVPAIVVPSGFINSYKHLVVLNTYLMYIFLDSKSLRKLLKATL